MICIYSIKKANAVMLTIEDNGVGIITKDINRVFEKDLLGRTEGNLAKVQEWACIYAKTVFKIRIENWH